MDYLGASGRQKRQFQAVDVEMFEITSVYSRDRFDLKSPFFFFHFIFQFYKILLFFSFEGFVSFFLTLLKLY